MNFIPDKMKSCIPMIDQFITFHDFKKNCLHKIYKCAPLKEQRVIFLKDVLGL